MNIEKAIKEFYKTNEEADGVFTLIEKYASESEDYFIESLDDALFVSKSEIEECGSDYEKVIEIWKWANENKDDLFAHYQK